MGKDNVMKEFRRFISFLGRDKYLYWFILVTTLVVESALQILFSYINKQTLNAIEYQNRKQFKAAIVACVVVVILKCIFPYLRYFHIKLVRKIVFEIKLQLFDKLLHLKLEFFEKNHSGEFLKVLNWDANSLKDAWFSHVYWVLGKMTTGISAFVCMLLYSPRLTGISVLISGITVWSSIKINDFLRKRAKSIEQKLANLTKHLSDILCGFPILKMYEGAFLVVDNYLQENHRVTTEEKKRVQLSALLEAVSFLLGLLGSFGTIFAGMVLVKEEILDYGTVMAVVTLQMSLSSCMQRLGSSMATLSTSLVKAGRVFDFLELTWEEKNKKQLCTAAEQAYEGKGAIHIHHLCFSYDGQEDLFHNMELTLAPGEKVLLMGKSGKGKSTLLKLLLHFYDVKSGQIFLYGKDICDYGLDELRNNITYVPQNNYLFEGTVMENIGYGTSCGHLEEENAEILKERIYEAARLANAYEFIMKLPDGFDTRIHAGGSNLSGGQRQRIALARAFLKDASVVLMDEPLSALDEENEARLQQTFQRLFEGKTVLMITHKQCFIKGFDRIITL